MILNKIDKYLNVLDEVKTLRGWAGKLDNIGKIINWMISKNILTKNRSKEMRNS